MIDYYHQTLKKNPSALRYLEERGLVHPELIHTFTLGYSDRSLGLKIPDRQVKEGFELRKRLVDLGILRESGHEHFRGSLVIPVMDENGTITDVYGRKTGKKLRKGTPLHLYLKGDHQGSSIRPV